MLSSGNLRDWNAVVHQVLRRLMLKVGWLRFNGTFSTNRLYRAILMLKAAMDRQSELIQNMLRDVQPVQISMQ